MTKIAEIIARARLPETTVTLCLRGDLLAEWRVLERDLEEAPSVAPSLGEMSPRRAIAERMEAIRGEMTAAEIPVRLRALPAREWSAYAARRPLARTEDEPEDAWRSRWYVWTAGLISHCAIDPEMTVEDVDQLVDVLSGVQWDELSTAAWALNEQRVAIPFSAAASAQTRGPEER